MITGLLLKLCKCALSSFFSFVSDYLSVCEKKKHVSSYCSKYVLMKMYVCICMYVCMYVHFVLLLSIADLIIVHSQKTWLLCTYYILSTETVCVCVCVHHVCI